MTKALKFRRAFNRKNKEVDMTKALKFRRAFNRKNKEVDTAINAIMAEYANDLEALAVETFGEPQADMDDPLAPPPTPVMVECRHCGRRYSSADMRLEYRPYNQPAICKRLGHDVERLEPMWWCPTERCDGAGFGFDIFPVRPSRRTPSTPHAMTVTYRKEASDEG